MNMSKYGRKEEIEKMIGLEYIVKEFQMEYKEVAKSIGISPQTMQDWVKKRRKIPVKRLGQLSDMFNFPTIFFQKELNFTEKGEVAIRYLERISKNEEIPMSSDEGEITHYYNKGTYEDEIQFIKGIMEKKEKQNNIRQSFEKFMMNDDIQIFDDLDRDGAIKEPLLSDSSNTETLNKIINVMADERLVNNFKIMVHLLNVDDELGGNPKSQITREYRDFAKDFIELLQKYKIKDECRGFRSNSKLDTIEYLNKPEGKEAGGKSNRIIKKRKTFENKKASRLIERLSISFVN